MNLDSFAFYHLIEFQMEMVFMSKRDAVMKQQDMEMEINAPLNSSFKVSYIPYLMPLLFQVNNHLSSVLLNQHYCYQQHNITCYAE